MDLPGTPPRQVEPEEKTTTPVETVMGGDLAVITTIWQELLGIARIEPHDDYFELGGHSLLATQILARISDALDVALPAGAIFEAPTPARLARLLAATGTEPAPEEPAAAEPADAELARLLADIRQMSTDELRAELDRARDAREIPSP